MQHVFSPEGDAALARTLKSRPLLAFDFDGTLTPAVVRPNDTRLSLGVASRLALLASQLPLAVVTGRSEDDIRERLGFEPTYIAGNQGAEEASPVKDGGGPAQAMHNLRARLEQMLPALDAAGVSVDDRAQSIALHYRLSRTRERALQTIAELLAERDDTLRVFGGKLVVTVVPKQASDKADAVHALMQRSGSACALFVGDDMSDEPVFDSASAGWLTIRVGRDNSRSKAQFFLDSPAETALLLDRMATLTGLR